MPPSSASFLRPEINHGGALDIVIVRQDDGHMRSTDWFVAFDTLDVPSMVQVVINGTTLNTGDHQLYAPAVLMPGHFVGPNADVAGSALPPQPVVDALEASGLLRDGRNEICYRVAGSQHKTYCVRAFLYLWHAARRAVIFDVDGTITLNDIAGQVANIVDNSPTHDGVCEMLCELHARGYSVAYLTSRPLLDWKSVV